MLVLNTAYLEYLCGYTGKEQSRTREHVYTDRPVGRQHDRQARSEAQ